MNNSSPQLPKRPKHFLDESLSGYLFRLFHANHFTPNTTFLKDLELTHSQLSNNEIPEQVLLKICPWIEMADTGLNNNTYRIQGTLIQNWYNNIIQKNNLKYCPLCIQEKYYHRLEWCILPLKVCSKHFVMLQEGCPSCQNPISIHDFFTRRCKFCLIPYTRTSLEYVNFDILKNSQAMIVRSLLYNEKSTIFELQAINYLKLAFTSFIFLDGCTDFTGFSNDILDVFYNRRNKIKSSLNFAVAFTNVDWMYSSFPDHFYHVLDCFLFKNKGMRKYGAFQKFEQLVQHDVYSELREAFHLFCIQKLESGIIRRDFGVFRSAPNLLQKRKVIRREEVKTQKGVTYGKMLRLSRSNLVFMDQSKKNEYYVDENTLSNYLEEEKKWITNKEASLILGIHAASIESLISSNLLHASSNYSGRSKRVNLDKVNFLMEQCKGMLVISVPDDYIKFHDALIKYSVNNLTVISVVQFILCEKLKPVRICSKATFADLYFKLDELKQCLLELKLKHQKEHGYYFSDLLKEFHIGEKRLRHLLEQYDIQPDYIIYLKDGRTRYLFREATISKIRDLLFSNDTIRKTRP